MENCLIREIQAAGFTVLPIFTYAMADKNLGAYGVEAALEKFCFLSDGTSCVDGMIRLAGMFNHSASSEVMQKLAIPVIKPICSYSMTVEEWEENPDGTIADVAWSIALPELDGVIEPMFIGAQERQGEAEHRVPVESRVKKLVRRLAKWVNLRKKDNKDKKVVFMLNNNPCTSVEASVGGGANLDTLESVVRVMRAMEDRGYNLENIPASGEELIQTIMGKKALSNFRWTTTGKIVNKGGALDLVSRETYESWFAELPEDLRSSIVENWGEPVGEGMVYGGKLLVTGVRFGNTIVCAQPKRGCMGSKCDGSSCKLLHDPHIPPTHQYLATYRWFERVFGADVLIHVGTHGNLEFLPGKSVAQSDSCCTDACLGDLPLLYIYNADNPPEATIAKRRAMAVTVDHMQTVMVSGGLYDKLEELDNLLSQYEKTKIADASQAHLMEHLIFGEIQKNELLPIILTRQGRYFEDYGMTGGELVAELDRVAWNIIRLFLDGGDFKGQQEIMGNLKVMFALKFEAINEFRARVEDIAKRIQSSREIDSLLAGMSGDFIPAGPAGIVTRGRDDVLPTGRNMYSLDPEKVPTKAAWEVGRRLGNAVIDKFLKEENRIPKTWPFTG